MIIFAKDDPIFEQAHETFKTFTANDELRELYEAREKRLKDEASLREMVVSESRAEGERAGIMKTAAALKKLGQPIDVICQATGLTVEDIEAL